jgi:O-antigen/teichoic acid export membrane protein
MNAPAASTEIDPHLASSVATNAGWLTVAQAVRRLLRLGVLFLGARLLGIERFGEYALLLTVVELVALVTGFGYGDFLTREIARQPEIAWRLQKRVTQIRLAYLVPCVGGAFLLLKILRFPGPLVLNAVLLSLSLIPRVISESAQGVMKGLQKFRPLLWIELVQGSTLLAVALLLLLKGFGVKGMIAAEILGAVAGALTSILAVVQFLKFTGSILPGFSKVARSMIAFNIYPVIATVYDRVDVVMLSKLVGNIATGIYSVPYRVFASLSIIPYGVMGALLPVFSSSEVNQETRQNCSRAMKFLYLAALLVVLITLAFARPVVLAVLGQSYYGSIITIKVLAWASIPMFLNYALNTLLLASHKEKIFIWTASICTVFNISANLLLIPRFSYVGAAVATLLTELLLLGQNYFLITKFLGEPIFPKNSTKITLAFAVMLASFVLLRRWIPEVLAGAMVCAVFAAFAAGTSKGLLRGPKAIGNWLPNAR